MDAFAPHAVWRTSPWPSLLMSGLIIAIALAGGTYIREREKLTLEVIAETGQAAVVSEIERSFVDALNAIERLASSWERRSGLLRSEFEAEASMLVRDLPSFQGIGWVDPSFHVRWMVPVAGNEAAEGLDLGFEQRRRQALEASRDEVVTTISGPIELVQGGLGFIAYVPLEVDGRFEGFIGGVWRASDFFSELLQNVAPGLAVRVTNEGEQIYARDASVPELSWGSAARVSGLPRHWSVEVALLPPVVAAVKTKLPVAVGAWGVALALSIVTAWNLARVRLIRNRKLVTEIELRRVAEQGLTTVLEAIPDHVWSGEVTPDGFQTEYYSLAIEKISGRPADTYAHGLEAWYETVHEADVETLRRAYTEILTGHRQSFELEYRIRIADGTLAWVLERVNATPTERGVHLDGITSDITMAKQNEAERLSHQQEVLLLKERARMTREMHDGLGGQLVAMIAMLEMGQSAPHEVAEAARRALDDMRIVIDSLDPRTTDLTTSLGKLRARLESSLKRNNIVLRWQIEDVPGLDDFPPEQTLHLLRVIQEAATNAMRHANAREVSIEIHATGAHAELLFVGIRDDGCGFRTGAAHQGRGIRNIESRADELGAELRFESDDSGTRIELRVPLPPQRPASA